MVLSARILIVVLALIAVFAGSGENAYAHGKHAPKPPKVHHAKKNSSIYDYLGAKNQKKHKGYYQGAPGGVMLDGKKKK